MHNFVHIVHIYIIHVFNMCCIDTGYDKDID